MSVTIRPYVNGGWEADIRVELPDGTVIRERKKAPSSSKTAAQRWAEARERVLLVHGKPKPVKKEEVQEKPTLNEFASRFLDGYAKANRLKPSGIAAKKSILGVHLIPLLGDKRLGMEGPCHGAQGWAVEVRAAHEASDGSSSSGAASARSASPLRPAGATAHAENRSGDDAAGRSARERQAGCPSPAA
jgi:hypothetical protein